MSGIFKLPCLTEYELELNARKPCVARDKYHKRQHALTPEDLKKGFGLHTLSSLEIAIKKARTPKHICLCDPCDDTAEEEEALDEEPSQQRPSYLALLAEERLRYLMGLPSGTEEASARASLLSEQIEGGEGDEEEDLITGTSDAMRQAQRYLREHKIFEFFQFLIAHLLAEIPFDPIAFLINLLDKCLIYRSGIADPPLLYQKPHMDCLFNLMDRMRTGFIDYDQYKTGMYTLGIKSYNPEPPMTAERQVTKLFFIEEGFECLKDLLNDMIRKRTHEVLRSRRVPKAPPPSIVKSMCPSLTNANLFV